MDPISPVNLYLVFVVVREVRKSMRAADIMTTDIITVGPNTPVPELAALLAERGISGVPLVDQDRVIGIVSEGDLLHRAETGTERRRQRRRFRWFAPHPQQEARDYLKSQGRIVKDIMTSEVILVSDTADLANVAELLETNRVKRVPVLHDGKLVGIISRANLIRALALVGTQPAAATESDDFSIRQKLLAELRGRNWLDPWAEDIVVKDAGATHEKPEIDYCAGSRNPESSPALRGVGVSKPMRVVSEGVQLPERSHASPLVKDGTVHFWLLYRSEDERRALRVAAENIPGVRGVEEHWAEPSHQIFLA